MDGLWPSKDGYFQQKISACMTCGAPLEGNSLLCNLCHVRKLQQTVGEADRLIIKPLELEKLIKQASKLHSGKELNELREIVDKITKIVDKIKPRLTKLAELNELMREIKDTSKKNEAKQIFSEIKEFLKNGEFEKAKSKEEVLEKIIKERKAPLIKIGKSVKVCECGKELAPDWKLCPYCTKDLDKKITPKKNLRQKKNSNQKEEKIKNRCPTCGGILSEYSIDRLKCQKCGNIFG